MQISTIKMLVNVSYNMSITIRNSKRIMAINRFNNGAIWIYKMVHIMISIYIFYELSESYTNMEAEFSIQM